MAPGRRSGRCGRARPRASRSGRRRRSAARAAHEHPELIGLGLARGRALPRLAALSGLGGRHRRREGRDGPARRARVGRVRRAARARRRRRPDALPQRTRRRDAVPHRPRRRALGLMITLGADHGGVVGNAARRRAREAARRHRLASSRPDRAARGRPAALRRLVRRHPPPLRVTSCARAPSRAPDASVRSSDEVAARRRRRSRRHEPPVDVVQDYPDVVSEGLSEPLAAPARAGRGDRGADGALRRPARRGGVRAARPRRAQGLAAGSGKREGRRPAHRRHARARRSRTSASRRRSSARSPARA